MRSFLIVGGNQKERKERAKKLAGNTHPIDTIIFTPDPSIGIEQIRELKKNFSLKPIKSKQKVVFIFEAQKMTIPAQNALLKTLEEPPGNNFLILTSPNPDLLLPTISSRCQIINLSAKTEIKLKKENFLKHWQVLREIITGGVGERLILSEKIAKNRQEATDWLKMQTVLWRQLLLFATNCTQIIFADSADFETDYVEEIKNLAKTLSVKQIIETLKNIEQAQKILDQSVHVRLAIDNLLLEYPRLP